MAAVNKNIGTFCDDYRMAEELAHIYKAKGMAAAQQQLDAWRTVHKFGFLEVMRIRNIFNDLTGSNDNDIPK